MRYLPPLLLMLCAVAAQAQYEVSLTLPRTNYLALEAIPATVTVTNRTGAEAVLGGPGRGSWLSFEMTDKSGLPLAPLEVAGDELIQIPAGGTIQQKVVVTDAYAPTDIGNYGLKAKVAHPASGQFYTSARVRFNITDSKPIWEQAYGVPEGFKGAGSARRYAVLLFSDVDSNSLYVRVIDDKSGLRLQTFRLGPVSMAHDPQISLDRVNQLNVLFLVQPNIYAHCIVAPDGTLKKRTYYREEEGNRPKMTLDGQGEVTVAGGVFFDPSKPSPSQSSKPARNISERPPGL